MNIDLKEVDIKDKNLLGDLIKEYQKEILNKVDIEPYKYLDSYWEKSDRHPFFVMLDLGIIGFVLINNYSVIEKMANSISELYIKKEFRNKGIGKNVAKKVFKLY